MFKHLFCRDKLFDRLGAPAEELLEEIALKVIFLEMKSLDDLAKLLEILTKEIPEVNVLWMHWLHSIEGRRLMRMKTSIQLGLDPATCSAEVEVRYAKI